MAETTLEAPSGKTAADENFPVGSWLLPRALRPHVAIYYGFARTIDDIADDPDLAPADKVARLDRFAAALTGRETADPRLIKAHRLRASMAETGVTVQHGVDLVTAFKRDATKLRYADWPDLMSYCEVSANPVGRYLLDLHGESRAGYPASDALCSALQVLNHLQDAQDDYRNLDRVYLPQDWLAAEAIDATALDASRASPGLRRVLDRCLDGTAALLATARMLPDQLADARLAMESAAIVRLAEQLAQHLRARDPLSQRVVLSRPAALGHGLAGALGVLARRQLTPRRTLQARRRG